MKLKPLEFKDSTWSSSGQPFQNVFLNNVLLFRIETDSNYLGEKVFHITSFSLIPKMIIADKPENDVPLLTVNSFKTLGEAQIKCEEIVENFVMFFLEV